MTDRKTIAQDLDLAASRAASIGRQGATRKQVWLLAGLLADAGEAAKDIDCGVCNTSAILTSRMASEWIDRLKSEQKVA